MTTEATYWVEIVRSAEKEFLGLPKTIQASIARLIVALGKNPRPVGYKKLAARTDYRIRKGDYRIVYEINDVEKKVTVLAIRHRKDVYR